MNANDTISQSDDALQGIHVVAKPIGPLCNLNCEYCFYLEKQALFAPNEKYRMTDDVLRAFITGYISSQPTPVVEFVWQGGEPTLLGIDFFKRAVELQKHLAGTKTIANALQTNGTLLTDEWCAFLKKHNFIVGISLDGPQEIHDRYRHDRKGAGSFVQVMHGLKLLQKHGVEYNILACVARETARNPLDIYRFFKDQGVEFIQFTPVVERMPDRQSVTEGLRLAAPAALDSREGQGEVTGARVLGRFPHRRLRGMGAKRCRQGLYHELRMGLSIENGRKNEPRLRSNEIADRLSFPDVNRVFTSCPYWTKVQ